MEESKDITKEFLSFLVNYRQVRDLREIFDTFNVVDLAERVGEMDLGEALFIMKTLRKDVASEVFSYLEPEQQERLIELLTGSEIKGILDNLYSDDIMEFIGEMPDVIAKKVLKAASPNQRAEINLLLSYKENSCGSIMSTDFVELNENDTILQAMEEIKEQRTVAESISYGYVVSHEKLVGIISLRDIIFAPNDAKITDLMESDVVFVKTSDDRELAIDEMKKYDILMIPVCDEGGQLVGIITADDVIDAMEEEATEDIHLMAAVNPMEGSYLTASPFHIAKSRLPWLMVLMVSAALSEIIITKNSYLIALFPALSYFYPSLMDTAGNAGSQSSAMVIRAIVTDGINMHDFFKVLWKELRVAAVCGIVMFAVNMLRIMVTMPNVPMDIAFISSFTVFAIIVVAKLIGGVLPLLASAVHLDPAVMASPLIATACDAISLTLYFGLAAFLLQGGM